MNFWARHAKPHLKLANSGRATAVCALKEADKGCLVLTCTKHNVSTRPREQAPTEGATIKSEQQCSALLFLLNALEPPPGGLPLRMGESESEAVIDVLNTQCRLSDRTARRCRPKEIDPQRVRSLRAPLVSPNADANGMLNALVEGSCAQHLLRRG